MIALPRSLLRQFHAVLRRCATPADYSRIPFVVIRSSGKEVSLQATLTETAVRLDTSAESTNDTLAFSAAVLATIEGNSDEVVHLESHESGKGLAFWNEAGSTTRREFATVQPDAHLLFPCIPQRLIHPGADFRTALEECSRTAPKKPGGRNIHRILLRGGKGEIVGTDGHQLLVWQGFKFPWKQDVLLPRIDAWMSREIPHDSSVNVGRSDKHVFVRSGPWTFALTPDDGARFPSFENVIPALKDITTTLKLTPDDVALLRKELPRLPGSDDTPSAVILQVGKQVTVCGQVDNSAKSEKVQLRGAEVVGAATSVLMDRQYLQRALKLGFREIQIKHPTLPLCCRDDSRIYVWMPLTEPATPNPHQSPVPHESAQEKPSMAETNGKTSTNGEHSATATFDPLAEAESVKALLSEAQSRLARLLSALKQHRRQARAVRAAMQSLRELPPLSP